MRRLILYLVFLVVCFGMGHWSLQRIGADEAGLSDLRHYRDMAAFDYESVDWPFRYRVMVPTLAGVFLRATSGVPLGEWNRQMFALLVVNAALMSAAAMLLLEIGRNIELRDCALGVLPFLYLSSFVVASRHLYGLVDSSEALAVCLTLWLGLRGRWQWIPAVIGLSILGKETAFVFCAVIAIVLLAHERFVRGERNGARWLALVGGLIIGGGLWLMMRALVGEGPANSQVGEQAAFATGLARALLSKSIVYSFIVLGPLGAARLARLPTALVAATAAAGAVALVAAAWADIGENAARPLFNTFGPTLCLASTILIGEIIERKHPTRP